MGGLWPLLTRGRELMASAEVGDFVFVTVAQLDLLLVTACIAGISAVALIWSIQAEDAVFAWIWAVVFALSSFLAAWSLWRLV